MSRSADAVLIDLISLLPPGWAWARRPGRVLPLVLAVIAAAIARVEALSEELKGELDPGQATKLLDRFEAVLGPDPCGLDDLAAPIGTRRMQAWRRWTWTGGASKAWFIALAAKYGVTITIETYQPVVCGDEMGASPLICSPEQFVWKVGLPLTWERRAICGDQVCGELMGEIGLSPVECIIRRFAPAHTTVVFAYG